MKELDLQSYAHYWTTDRDQLVLVRVDFPDGGSFYDIYQKDGTYCTPPNEELNRAVVARMQVAGVSEMDADAWVLHQKMSVYKRFWTEDPGKHLIIRHPRHEAPPLDLIYDEEERQHFIYEEAVRYAVVDRMISAGVELVETVGLVETAEALCGDRMHATKEADSRIENAHRSANCVLKLLVRPSFSPYQSWQLHQHYHFSPDHLSFSARILTWSYETPLRLPLRESVRLPAAQQSWHVNQISHEFLLDLPVGLRLLERLSQLLVPAYVDHPHGGRDGTDYELTAGTWPTWSQWSWWCRQPDEWQDLIEFSADFRAALAGEDWKLEYGE